MKALVLALDVGTSSTRSALFDHQGKRLIETTFQKSYPLQVDGAGRAELLPHHLLHALTEVMKGTIQAYRKNKKLSSRPILGVGMSCFWHSLMGLDREGDPLMPVITWADSRSAVDAAALRKELDEREVHSRTGCMLRTSFWPSKLRGILRTQPKLFSKVVRWVSPAEWLYSYFCDYQFCAPGMATGTGFYNPSALAWDENLMKQCEIDSTRMNPVSLDSSGMLQERRRVFPELANARWFAAIGDGAASNLGSGATRPGLAAINFGTSAALRVVKRGKVAQAPFGLFCYRIDEERYLVGGAISNAGNLRAWSIHAFREPDEKTIERYLRSHPLPDHGLTVLPFWTAERAPTWPEELPGMIVGLRQSTTALQLLQATTEASFLRLAQIAGEVQKVEKSPLRFLVSGGIQKSRSAMQRLADILGRPVMPNPEPEASLRGAAVYVLERLSIKFLNDGKGPEIRHRPMIHRAYQEARLRQETLEQRCLQSFGSTIE